MVSKTIGWEFESLHPCNKIAMPKIKSFLLGAIDEMQHKVTWPTYDQLQSSSKLVLTASFIFAIVIGLIDLVFKNSVAWFYNNF